MYIIFCASFIFKNIYCKQKSYLQLHLCNLGFQEDLWDHDYREDPKII